MILFVSYRSTDVAVLYQLFEAARYNRIVV
jgi:hypothetical protein